MTDRRPDELPAVPGQPQYRLSDQERDEAIQALAEAYAEGRLDVTEFEERMELAGQARFAVDLDPLFVDLPRRPRRQAPIGPGGPADRRALARQARHERRAQRRGGPAGMPGHAIVIAVLALIALVVTGHFWVLFPAWFLIGHVLRSQSRGGARCGGRSRTW